MSETFFRARRSWTLRLKPQGRPSADFTATATIDDRRITLSFYWNRKYRFYCLAIGGPDGHILTVYPRVGEAVTIAGFNPKSQPFRDATIVMSPVAGHRGKPTPETIFGNYAIRLVTGRLVGERS